MISAGILAALGIIGRSRRVELVGLVSLALMSLLHGGLILIVACPAADQTAVRILIGFFSVLAWAGARWQRGMSRHELSRVDDIANELRP